MVSHLSDKSSQALVVKGLWQRYQPKQSFWQRLRRTPTSVVPSYAVADVSFEQSSGRVLCILGENGAGKTTLIRTLTTLMTPHQGDAWVMGHHTKTHSMLAKQSLGVVFQQNHFNRYLTVWDNVKLHATLHGLSEKQATKRMTELFESLGMMSLKHRHPDALSGGQQRRVAMIRALVHRPKLLFLDEPSTGLDPQARRQVWRMIKTLQADHALSVVLTTHYMEEAETLSDDMLLLHEGRMLFHGSKQALKQQFASASLPQTLAVHPSLGTPTRYVCTLSRWLTQEEQIQLEAYFYQHYPHLPACFRFPEGEAQPTQSPRFDWYLYPLTHETHPNPSPQAPVPWQRPELGELASFLNQYTGTQLLGIQPYVMPLEDILDALSQVPS